MADPILKDFPYSDLRLTPPQAAELADRINHFRFLLTDVVGLAGHTLCMDDASVANIAAHLALAGVPKADDDLALIWGRVHRDESGVYRDTVEWTTRKPQQPPPDDRAAMREQMKRQIPAGILEALQSQLAEEYTQEMS